MTKPSRVAVVANSRVAGMVARCARSSVIWQAARPPIGRLLALWRDLGRADDWLNAQARLDDSPVAPRLVASQSRALRPVLSLAPRLARAADTSFVVRQMVQVAATGRALPPADAVRLIGVAAVCAAATHGLALIVTPVRLRPAMPWPVEALMVGAALTMVVASTAVARAWAEWRRR